MLVRSLPYGIEDRLPPTALKRQLMMTRLLQFFYEHGFDFIDPPLLEYQESFSRDDFIAEGFLVLDPIAGESLMFRPDMTLGVARIATGALSSSPRPLKLCYGGDVLRPEALNGKRQITQVGIEMIGGKDEAMVVELLCGALDDILLRPFYCDLALPDVSHYLLAQIPDKDRATITDHVRHKDRASLMNYNYPEIKILLRLMAFNGLLADKISDLKSFTIEKTIGMMVKRFIDLAEKILAGQKKLRQAPIMLLDATELLGYDYKTGFAFTLFDKESKSTLGRGGHYRTGKEDAVGFSLYLDYLLPMVRDDIFEQTIKRK